MLRVSLPNFVVSANNINAFAVTIDPVIVNIANWLLIRQPEQ